MAESLLSSRLSPSGLWGDGAEAALWLVLSLFLYPALNMLITPSSTLYASRSDKKVFLMDNFL